MMSDLQLNYKDKVLLFLKDYSDIDMRDQIPEDITQKGISDNVGMSRTHTSRVLKRLREKDLLKEGLADVQGHERKLKGYRLTPRGFEKAKDIFDRIKKIEIPILDDGEEISMKIEHILERYGKRYTLLGVIEAFEKNDLPINLNDDKENLFMIDSAPNLDGFVDRKRELKELKDWYESKVTVGVILGRRGYGCSTLANAFIQNLDRHVLWIKIDHISLEMIKNRITSFLKKLDENDDDDVGKVCEDILEDLCKKDVLVIFDDYYDVDDDVVDFLDDCIDMSEKGINSKFLITARKGIPVYERFYKIEDVENDKVREIELSSLHEKDAQELLDTKLDKEALDRIMLMTKGSPLLLKLLRDGDKKELNRVSPLSKEQISLLMFLKTKERAE